MDENKCKTCGKDTSGHKCAECGNESEEKMNKCDNCGGEKHMAKCSGCDEAEENCTCPAPAEM